MERKNREIQMKKYVDGFLLVVPKNKLNAYRDLAAKAGAVWMDHGALEYRECVGDDLSTHMGLPFARLVKLKRNELVFFSWIVYRSRSHRDKTNEKVMKDPRFAAMIDMDSMPFDMKRMSHGGFEVLVDLASK